MNRRLNINVIDTVHDFAKGKRVSGTDVKNYIIKELFKDGNVPAAENTGLYIHPTIKSIATNKSGNVEHVADTKINMYSSQEFVSFQHIANDVDVNKYINSQPENMPRKLQPMKRITIPYSFLPNLPLWMQTTFSECNGFTLDVTVLPESIFCDIPNNVQKIHKSLATMYDRVAANAIDMSCMEEKTPSVDLFPGEVLFLSEVSMPGSEKNTISWKYNDRIQGTINVDSIIEHRDQDKSLTLFGKMIGHVLGIKRGDLVLPSNNRSRSPSPQPPSVVDSTKFQVHMNKTNELLARSADLIKKLYGLDIRLFEDKLGDYIGILTDFKRMGDLLQIKVAELSKNVYVTNDIVSSIMSSVGYNCPTMRTGKRFGDKEDDEDDTQHSDRTVTLFQVKTGNIDDAYQRLMHTLQQYAASYKKIQHAYLKSVDPNEIKNMRSSCKVLLEEMFTIYEDTYHFYQGERTSPKQIINLGIHLFGIAIVYVQQILIILTSYENISNAPFDDFHDILHIDAPLDKKYNKMLAFFAKYRLPLPNTLFTTNPENHDVGSIIEHMRVRLSMVQDYVNSRNNFNASTPFDEYYKFMAFTDDPFTYIPIVDFPSKSLLPYARLFKSFVDARPVVFLGEKTNRAMEIGWDRDVQHKKLTSAKEFIDATIRDHQEIIKNMGKTSTHGGTGTARTMRVSARAPARVTTRPVERPMVHPTTRKKAPAITFTQQQMFAPTTTIKPRKGLPSPNTSLVNIAQMQNAAIELEKVNLWDEFLDALWVKATTYTKSPNKRNNLIVLFFQLSLLKDVLRWNIPVYVPR